MNAEQSEALRKALHFFRLAALGQSELSGMRPATAYLLAARFLAEARDLGTPEEELVLFNREDDFGRQFAADDRQVWEAIGTAIETLSRHVAPAAPPQPVKRMGGEPQPA